MKTAEPLSLAYVTKLQSFLREQLNRYRYILDINRLPCSVAYFTLLITLTKTLPFWYFTSKHYHSNTVNVLCHVSGASFPSFREFCNSPIHQLLYFFHLNIISMYYVLYYIYLYIYKYLQQGK